MPGEGAGLSLQFSEIGRDVAEFVLDFSSSPIFLHRCNPAYISRRTQLRTENCLSLHLMLRRIPISRINLHLHVLPLLVSHLERPAVGRN